MITTDGLVRVGRSARLATLVVMSAIGGGVGAAMAQTPATVQVAVTGRSNESVSVAADGQFVAMVWGASTTGGMDVFSAVSRDGGATFTSPVRVNAVAFDARVGGEQPPHVVLVPRRGAAPSLVVVWTAKRAEGSRLLMARSDDGGVSFGATTVVPGTAATGNRGWESVTANARGGVHVLWLDHRDLPATPHQHGAVATSGPAAPAPDSVERASYSKLYVASLDGSTPPKAITGNVCYCCKTSFVAGSDGTLYGVWRHVYPGDLRDIALTSSRDGGRTFSAPLRVSEDHWEFDGCPDNGPSLAVDGARRVHVVWPSPADVKDPRVMALYYAVSRDGAAFAPRVRVPTAGPAGHVQVIADSDRGLVVAWEEMTAAGRSVVVARGTTDAVGRASFRRVGTAETGRYPSLAATSTGVVMAWTSTQNGANVISVRRIGS